jgi:hypothetical protein
MFAWKSALQYFHSFCVSRIYFLIYFYFIGGTGVWSQDCMLRKQALYCLSHTSSPFCFDYFGDMVLWTICLDWPWIMILPISAPLVARIITVKHLAPGFVGQEFRPGIAGMVSRASAGSLQSERLCERSLVYMLGRWHCGFWELSCDIGCNPHMTPELLHIMVIGS